MKYWILCWDFLTRWPWQHIVRYAASSIWFIVKCVKINLRGVFILSSKNLSKAMTHIMFYCPTHLPLLFSVICCFSLWYIMHVKWKPLNEWKLKVSYGQNIIRLDFTIYVNCSFGGWTCVEFYSHPRDNYISVCICYRT